MVMIDELMKKTAVDHSTAVFINTSLIYSFSFNSP
ncbi:hypothetical protein SAMN04488553_0112 [Gramella sp. MAR_2010_147]|nr:hypothetical protein SAMN04488553_0112 [Gramella sp. MAR_2010_147]